MPLFKPLFRWAAPAVIAAVVTCPQAFAAVEFKPTLTSTPATAIGASTTTAGGNISSLGDSVVTARGVVYAKTTDNANPEIGGANVTVVQASGSANTLGAFTVNLSGLNPATGYSFKAFATNTAGTSYGSVETFTTLIEPTVISPTSTAVGSTSATLGGNVTDDGMSTITERGVVISRTTLNSNPVIGGANVTKVVGSGTLGVFTVGVTGLSPGVGYSFKAYATNGVGTSYTTVSTFTTLTVPTLALAPTSSAITVDSATLGGNVTSDGLSTITERGVVYAITTANGAPQIGGAGVTKLTSAGTTGVFTVSATGLKNGTAYTFASYAINSVGTTYSNFGSFDTLAEIPIVTSPTKSSVTTNTNTTVSSATLGGTVSLPGSEVIERGVVYSPTTDDSNPFVGESSVTKVVHPNTAGTTGAFTLNITGLLPYVSYTFKAYVKNSGGVYGYSAADSFTTPAVAPVVNSGATATAITDTTATLSGNVTKSGGRALNEVGFVYAATLINGNPLLNGSGVTKVTGPASTGVFSIPVSGLSAGTQYSFKAFATTAAGTSYSSLITFTTLTNAPTISGRSQSSITSTSATLGANVTDDGSLTITERGVVYSLTAENSNPTVGGANVTKRTTGGTTGVFTVSVTGLEAGQRYSFAAYAKNSEGTSYTAVGTFTTVATEPTITAPGVGSIQSRTAVLGSTVTKDNGADITERGVVYSLTSRNSNPRINGTGVIKQTASGTTGAFTVNIGGLTPAKNYSFAAYARNSVGITYTSVATFTTDAEMPSVSKPTVTSVTSSTARLGGTVVKDGGSAITQRGVVYSITSKNSNPVIGNSGVVRVVASGAIGQFVVPVSSLQPDTKYSFRVFATNSVGTKYTAAETFTTGATAPKVNSPTVAKLGSGTATLGGNVASDNGSEILARGVVYSLSYENNSPRLGEDGVFKVTTGSGTGEFAVLVSKLQPGKKYTFAAFARNSLGTTYSGYRSFTTKTEAPTVNLRTKDEVTSQSAVLGGNVANAGGLTITERGVVYSSIVADPTLGASAVSSKSADGTTGRFSILVEGLLPSTRYYFRAYAKNSKGVSYTPVGSFTTSSLALKSLVGTVSGSALESDTTETVHTIDAATGLKYLTIVIHKSPGTESRQRTVEVSGNLTDWFSGSRHTTVIQDDAGILSVRDNTPVTAGGKRYIRLK